MRANQGQITVNDDVFHRVAQELLLIPSEPGKLVQIVESKEDSEDEEK